MFKELTQNIIYQYAAHWEDLGLLLGLEDYVINNIAKNFRNECVDACREMFREWLQNGTSPTWGRLDDKIKSLMKILASKPRSKFTL